MARAFILLLDSFGIGEAPDAQQFGDVGSNTFGHIVDHKPAINLPNLTRLGLVAAAEACGHREFPSLAKPQHIAAQYGHAVEKSFGKDTPSGHWEIAGVPVLFDWGYFPPEYPSFPEALVNTFIKEADLPGIIGNKHASGTTIINELGDEHVATGKPILYTSADSVFQIACHEEIFGLERLYHICEIARRLVDPYNIGRVIARPFTGSNGNYQRTGNRRDYSTPPPEPTLLEYLKNAGRHVYAIGKVADIFAHQGITHTIKANGNMALFDALLKTTQTANDGSLTFVNFVDFDSKYGHRRDIDGYAGALEALDMRLPEFEAMLQPDDIAIITADHGCDPSMPGSDHTRECIPVLIFGPRVKSGNIGQRETFSDIGQTIAQHLNIEPLKNGTVIEL